MQVITYQPYKADEEIKTETDLPPVETIEVFKLIQNSEGLNSIVVPFSEIQKAALLILEVFEGGETLARSKYVINACGMQDSKRFCKDGCTLFGSQDINEVSFINLKNEVPYNDIVLPDNENGVGKRHLIIKYSPDNRSYYIRDLGDGNGTFVKVDKPLVRQLTQKLKHGYIVSFGDSHMVIQIYSGDQKKIIMKFLDGPKTDQIFQYDSTYGAIMVGRMSDCDIKFEDNSLSRNQCWQVLLNIGSILFETGHWMLRDGNGDKPSTNGTWLFVDEPFKIFNDMIFKVGQTLFRTQLKYDHI